MANRPAWREGKTLLTPSWRAVDAGPNRFPESYLTSSVRARRLLPGRPACEMQSGRHALPESCWVARVCRVHAVLVLVVALLALYGYATSARADELIVDDADATVQVRGAHPPFFHCREVALRPELAARSS